MKEETKIIKKMSILFSPITTAVLIAALGSFQFGFNIGCLNTAKAYITLNFKWCDGSDDSGKSLSNLFLTKCSMPLWAIIWIINNDISVLWSNSWMYTREKNS